MAKNNQTSFKETENETFPKEWGVVKLNDVAEKIGIGPFGSSIKVETFVKDGIPVISGQHLRGIRLKDNDYNFIADSHAEKLHSANVFRGDVIFTHAGNIGQVAYIPNNSKYERYIISQRQFYLRCDKNSLLPEFITYFFKSPIGQYKLLSNKAQTGVPSISQPVTHLRNIEIPLPPIEEQKRIAEILGALDEMIELNRRMNDTLEKIASAIFKHWFVDFEFPNEQGKPFKSSGGKMIDSELGLIPEGWRVGKFGESIKNFDSKRIPLSSREREIRRGIYPYYGATSIMDWIDGYIFDGTYLLLGEDGSVAREDGKPFIQYVSGKIWVNNHAHVLIGANGFSTEYLKVFLEQVDIIPYVTGAVQPKLNQENMNSIPLVIPNKEILERFNQISALLFKTILQNGEESVNLTQIRDSLLPRLMGGKIRV